MSSSPEPIYPKHRYSPEVLAAADESNGQRADRWMARCDEARKLHDETLELLTALADKLKDDNVEHALRAIVKEAQGGWQK